MRDTRSHPAIGRLAIIGIVAILVVGGYATVFYVYPSIQRAFGRETIHLSIRVSYPGGWNGSYWYGSPIPGPANTVLWSGAGTMQRNFTFQGDLNKGMGYWVHFQKQDNSSAILSVFVISDGDHLPSHSNSTATPFGTVDFGVGAG
jgi:hypothetical protein